MGGKDGNRRTVRRMSDGDFALFLLMFAAFPIALGGVTQLLSYLFGGS